MRRVVFHVLVVVFALSSCTPEQTRPADQSATTLFDGETVFVVEPVELDCPDDASCAELIWVGPDSYVYPFETTRRFQSEAVASGVFAVGGSETAEFIEVRTLKGIPPEYALAARMEGSDDWVAIGGHPVEGTEMEDEQGLASLICDALVDRQMGWSFCQ
jgi:hypothetical protein